MKQITSLLILSALMGAGCGAIQTVQDHTSNNYPNVDAFPNAGAPYVGVWSTSTPGNQVCIKIYPDGTGKHCAPTSVLGTITTYAKIYKDPKGALVFINERGTRYFIDGYSSDHIDVTAYGKQIRFIPGVKLASCEDFLRD